MTELKLSERQKGYEDDYNYKIIPRIPVIIRVDGKNFSRLTRKCQKPYDPKLLEIMATSMFQSIMDIEGAVFGYQQSDEMTFVIRNDSSIESQPLFANRIQKIASVTSSLVTYNFLKNYLSMDEPPEIVGSSVFDARVFGVPTLVETMNNLIWRQQDCRRNAITSAALAALKEVYGNKTALSILDKKNSGQKIELLMDECGIDFENFYSPSFIKGVVAYKTPKVFNETIRKKWFLDKNPPFFMDNKEWLMHILVNGNDIFRKERDVL